MTTNPLTPPKGHYWCPYSRDYKPVLTEEQVRQMWPYAVPKKETMKKEDVKITAAPFKAGDRVVCVDAGGNWSIERDKEYTVAGVWPSGWIVLAGLEMRGGFKPFRFARVVSLEPAPAAVTRSNRPEWLDEMVDETIPRSGELMEAPVAQSVAGPNTQQTHADAVVLPQHYARFKIEPIRFAVENGLNVFQMNIVKYIMRHDAKNGLEDLRKARRYLDMFIKFQEGDPDWSK